MAETDRAMSHLTRSAAILAGGQATRFGGRDKSALLVDGRTILDRQLAALAPLTDDLMIVGDRDVAARAIRAARRSRSPCPAADRSAGCTRR